MSIKAALITGADPRYVPALFKSASLSLKVNENELSLIRYPQTEAALARVTPQIMPREAQETLRDVIYTKAHTSARTYGVRICIIFARVPCLRGMPGYEECEMLARREAAEVARWRLFETIHLRCLTPRSIEPVPVM